MPSGLLWGSLPGFVFIVFSFGSQVFLQGGMQLSPSYLCSMSSLLRLKTCQLE